ncbi:hypothetical protein VTN96DRAFT_9645 [Rasamsonia emersonii]
MIRGAVDAAPPSATQRPSIAEDPASSTRRLLTYEGVLPWARAIAKIACSNATLADDRSGCATPHGQGSQWQRAMAWANLGHSRIRR